MLLPDTTTHRGIPRIDPRACEEEEEEEVERDNCESLEKLSKGEKKRVGVEFDKWTRLSILSSNQVSSRSTVVSCIG